MGEKTKLWLKGSQTKKGEKREAGRTGEKVGDAQMAYKLH